MTTPTDNLLHELDADWAQLLLDAVRKRGEAASLRAWRMVAAAAVAEGLSHAPRGQAYSPGDVTEADQGAELVRALTQQVKTAALAMAPLHGAPEQRAVQRGTWRDIPRMAELASLSSERRLTRPGSHQHGLELLELLRDLADRDSEDAAHVDQVLVWARDVRSRALRSVANLVDGIVRNVASGRARGEALTVLELAARAWAGKLWRLSEGLPADPEPQAREV